MKKLILSFFCLFLITNCSDTIDVDIDGFEIFTIRAGNHSSLSRNEPFTGKGLDITALFDESAIYALDVTSDQADINKLIGFSDCAQHHQSESARLGWRWFNNQLEILAYAYIEGELTFELMGAIPLNTEVDMTIRVTADSYEFAGSGLESVSLQRTSDCDAGDNYWLWPYFGGNQVAPQDVVIKVKREQVN